MAFTAAFLVILLASPCVLAVDYPVTWTLGTDYSSWANRRFNVNDTLTFTYDNTHTVDVVTRSNFDSCNSASPISTDRSGSTTITLTEGTTYIICGTPGHCRGGMALQATATGSDSSSGSGDGSDSSPSPSSTPGASGSSAPPLSGGNGAAGLSSATAYFFGLPLVLATFFAFLG